jgi:hypothetical protein
VKETAQDKGPVKNWAIFLCSSFLLGTWIPWNEGIRMKKNDMEQVRLVLDKSNRQDIWIV